MVVELVKYLLAVEGVVQNWEYTTKVIIAMGSDLFIMSSRLRFVSHCNAGALLTPKGLWSNSYRPRVVMEAAFSQSWDTIAPWQYPFAALSQQNRFYIVGREEHSVPFN